LVVDVVRARVDAICKASMRDEESGVGDLLATLRRSTASLSPALGKSVSEGALKPSVSTSTDRFTPSFRPPPTKAEVKEVLANDPSRSYSHHTRKTGSEFHAIDRLRPQVLDQWAQSRMVSPDRSNKKAPSSPKYHAIPRDFPETHDEMCTQLHQNWLQEHRTKRDRQIHSEYHALVRVDEARNAAKDIAEKKALARDIITRSHLSQPRLTASNVASLTKVKHAVVVSRTFNKAIGIDLLEREEQRREKDLQDALAAEVLRPRVRTPEIRAKHSKSWTTTKPFSRPFQGSDLQTKDDDRELLQRRMRSTF